MSVDTPANVTAWQSRSRAVEIGVAVLASSVAPPYTVLAAPSQKVRARWETTITLRVDEAERDELVARAERERISLSDYIRVRLGLHGHGSQSDDEVQIDPGYEALREQLVEHDRRLQALEDAHARRHAGTS